MGDLVESYQSVYGKIENMMGDLDLLIASLTDKLEELADGKP